MRLSTETFEIEAIETGGDCPGWISSHVARLVPSRHEIVVGGGKVWMGNKRPLGPNSAIFALPLETLEWRRLSAEEEHSV